jgi:hypothetical protein
VCVLSHAQSEREGESVYSVYTIYVTVCQCVCLSMGIYACVHACVCLPHGSKKLLTTWLQKTPDHMAPKNSYIYPSLFLSLALSLSLFLTLTLSLSLHPLPLPHPHPHPHPLLQPRISRPTAWLQQYKHSTQVLHSFHGVATVFLRCCLRVAIVLLLCSTFAFDVGLAVFSRCC